MPVTSDQKGVQAWKPWAAVGLASIGFTLLSSQPASALSSFGLDNTNDQANTLPTGTSNRLVLTDQQWQMRTFKVGALDGYLSDLIVGVDTGTSASTLNVSIYKVSGTAPFPPIQPTPPATTPTKTFTLPSSTSRASGSYQSLTALGLGSLSSFLFQANQTYGIVFSSVAASTQQTGLRICSTGCTAPTMVASGVTLPITGTYSMSRSLNGGSSWSPSTNETAYMEINFTPVPAPALMGFSSLSGLMVYSRRLRSRIKGSVA